MFGRQSLGQFGGSGRPDAIEPDRGRDPLEVRALEVARQHVHQPQPGVGTVRRQHADNFVQARVR